MSKRNHIREFKSFQSKRKDIERINEIVTQKDDSFIVGGIQVDKKTVNAYIKKVKDQTGKDLKSMYSEMQIAEELMRWSASNLSNIDNVPISALMGGEEEMADEIDEDGELSDIDETGDLDIDVEEADVDTEGVDSDVDSDEEDQDADTDGDEDFEVDFNEDDFESPDEGDDTEGDDTEGDDTEGDDTEDTDEEDTDEEDEDTDLPI
jgi:hypothetical protein